jgi:hypothetical protein
MKKLFFGLVATVVFGMSASAQVKPDNSRNIYDYVGEIHNKELLSILTSKDNQKSFNDNYFEYTQQVLKNNKIDNSGFVSVIEDETVLKNLGEFNVNNVSLNEKEVNNWFNSKLISNDIKTFLLELIKVTETFNQNQNFSNLKESVIKLETIAEKYNENDKVFAMTVSSLTRHSYYFWTTNNKNISARGSVRGAAVADLAGAVAGGVRTAVVCAFTGPVGWGAWCGAVIGTGLGTSAAYGITCWLSK